MYKHLFGAALLLGAATVEAADDKSAGLGGVGVRLGSAGLAVDYTYGWKYFDLRAGYHFGAYSREQNEDGNTYDGELKIGALAAMLDVKPFGGGFRLSLGAFSSPPELNLAGKSNGEQFYAYGDRTYKGVLDVDGGIDLGSAAPYVGIGWGGTTNNTGFGMSFDIGVMFTQSPDASLDIAGTACDATATGNCDLDNDGFDVAGDTAEAQAFQMEVDKELANLEADAEDFKLWPVIMLGLHYRF